MSLDHISNFELTRGDIVRIQDYNCNAEVEASGNDPMTPVESGMWMEFQELFALGMKRYVPPLLSIPADRHVLNLGAGYHDIPGAIGLDLPDWDADTMDLPYPDEHVSGIHAYHFLEHVSDPIAVLRECERVLRPGGVMNIVVPYYNSQMFAHDLTHKHAFCEETWRNHFANTYFDRGEWRFKVGFNVIAGIKERNMALFTQLVKV